jgi:hypothetical protein
VNDQPLHDEELRALARQLGADAAERLDVERTAQTVLRRLREEPRVVREKPPLRTWLPLAAAVALLLGGGLVWRGRQPAPGSATATAIAPAVLDLSTLSADQLRELLDTMDQVLDVEPNGSSESGLDDLTPGELRSLLSTLEG